MGRKLTYLVLSGGFALLFFGCATKGYVREQVGSAEERVNQRIVQQEQKLAGQEAKLREASAEIEADRRRIEGLDAKVGEVGSKAAEASDMAKGAKEAAEKASSAVREVESRFARQFANRNRYTVVDTKTIYFDFGRSDLKDEAMTALLEVARVLKEDINAIIELQGHTDSRGNERFNLQLSQARVDAVVRYLVQHQGIELHRIHTIGFGEAVPAADNKTKEGRAKNRRVTIRILTAGGI